MMRVAKEVTVDWKDEKVYVDGERFEFWLHEDGPKVERGLGDLEDVNVVWLPVLAHDVREIR